MNAGLDLTGMCSVGWYCNVQAHIESSCVVTSALDELSWPRCTSVLADFWTLECFWIVFAAWLVSLDAMEDEGRCGLSAEMHKLIRSITGGEVQERTFRMFTQFPCLPRKNNN